MSELNNEQLQAVNSKSDRILCLAGAGAGKTKTMIDRIMHLVDEGTPPSSIMALTFTNAAAAEMKERYSHLNIGKEIPEFRTFHSFCYSIVCRDINIREALGYSEVPVIASEEQEKEIELKAKVQCNITLSKEQLKERNHLSKKEQFQVDLYDKAVSRLMRSANLITFDKLNSEVSILFASDHPSTKPYKQQYKYIFSDEFQDTDEFQIKFLNSFTDTNFYFCGDCLQNIYSFRGTSNEYIKALASTEGWEKIRLYTNYRSTSQICEYANKFSATYADPSYRIEMKGIREGNKVSVKLVDGPHKYSAINTKDIDNVLKEISTLEGTSAILCRTNKEVAAVGTHLKSNGVKYTSNRDNYIQQILDCATSDTYMLGLLASYLSSDKYGEYIRLSTLAQNVNLAWFIANYGNVPQIHDLYKQVVALKNISIQYGTISDKLAEVAKVLHLDSIPVPDTDYFGNDFLNYLKDTITKIKSSELYVGTIHSVKGLEYDNVFVMNVGSYSFKLNTEDMRNLFYVAITRAKNNLFVYQLFDS